MQWHRAEGFPGIRYYKHESRKHGIQFDKYFSGSYQVDGIRYTMGFGWGSQGWTAKKSYDLLSEFKHNAKMGLKPRNMKEMREVNAEKERKDLERKKKYASSFFITSGIGIYFLWWNEEIVYVGQSIDIMSRLGTHIKDREKIFNRVTFIECKKRELNKLEGYWIDYFKPKYNKVRAPKTKK